MVVVMQEGASADAVDRVVARLEVMGYAVHRSAGANRIILGVVGTDAKGDPRLVETFEGVQEVVHISEPFKLASRAFRPSGTVIVMGDLRIGGDEVVVMAGPCSAESDDQVQSTAAAVKRAGAKVLRGGAFKPRSSPYAFQGLGEDGLRMLRDAADAHNLKLVSEVMDPSQIEVVDRYADIFQIGARNMQNFALLRELGRARKPVLLKRGISATIEEWLLSAEYVLGGGNMEVILCERGIRTFETVHAQHPRHLRDPDRQEAEPPARVRGPQPRHRAPRQGGADGARRRRGGCRRLDHRGAHRSRSGPERRRADDVPVPVRSADGRTAYHRSGDRAVDLRGAGGPAGMGRAVTSSGRRLPVLGGAQGSGAAPSFQRIAIIGLGAVGGSLAMALREAWPASLIIGVDTHEAVEAAIRLHAIDVGAADLVVAGDADLVVLAGGLTENLGVLPFLADAIAGEAVVLVMGSAAPIAPAAQSLPDRLAIVAGLPAADVRGRGIHAASAALFRDRAWPVEAVSGPPGAVVRVQELVRAVGGVPTAAPPDAV